MCTTPASDHSSWCSAEADTVRSSKVLLVTREDRNLSSGALSTVTAASGKALGACSVFHKNRPAMPLVSAGDALMPKGLSWNA